MWAPRSRIVAESAELKARDRAVRQAARIPPPWTNRSGACVMHRLMLRAVAAGLISFFLTWGAAAQEATPATDTAPSTEQGGDATAAPVDTDVQAAPTPEAAAAAAAAAASSGNTDESGGVMREKIDDSAGSFVDTVPIVVPPFRGLEPGLALSYDSSGDNGFVGVGWRLAGLSVIERASPRRGFPRFDSPSTDIYLLDDSEMVACAQAPTSPSCTTGGTHATKVESYLRIKQNTAANTWQVTSRDGTKLTYQPVGAFAGGNQTTLGAQFRWVLASVVDTHGNTVQYNYWCD